MANNEIKLKFTGDSKGAESAMGRVKGALSNTVNGLNNVRRAIGKVFAALGIIGFVINGIKSLWEGFQKLKEWINSAETAARKLREEMEKRSYENAIKDAEAAYKKLNEQIERANRLEKERNQILDERNSRKRDIEDAQNALSKAKEIAALDPNADDYAERKRAIETKYQRHESRKAAQRADYDVKLNEYRLRQEAYNKGQAANKYTRMAKDMGNRVNGYDARLKWMKGNGENDPEKLKQLVAERDEFAKKRNEYTQKAWAFRNEADGLKKMADEVAKRVGVATVRDEATQLTITQGERERAAQKAKEEAKAKAAEEAKAKAEEERRQQAAAKEKARVEAEEARKVERQKSDEASRLNQFANGLAATNGVSQNRLTALGLGSGVAPRQNQIANDVKQLVKLMKDEIEATKNIGGDGELAATFTE